MEPGSPSSPGPPRTHPGLGRSYISMPQFLSVPGGVTAVPCCTGRCGNQLRNPSLDTSATGPCQHPASTQFSTFFTDCWGPSSLGRAGEACGQDAGRLEVAEKCPTQARPHCIWDLFICCKAFLWRDNAERMSVNCRAKVRVSWPSSSVQVLAPSQQLSHEPSLQIIFPALHPERREAGWLASAWPWGPCGAVPWAGGWQCRRNSPSP